MRVFKLFTVHYNDNSNVYFCAKFFKYFQQFVRLLLFMLNTMKLARPNHFKCSNFSLVIQKFYCTQTYEKKNTAQHLAVSRRMKLERMENKERAKKGMNETNKFFQEFLK